MASDLGLCLIAAGLVAVSGFVPRLAPRGAGAGEWIGCAIAVAGGVLGAGAAGVALAAGRTSAIVLGVSFAPGRIDLALDPASALFAIPVFVVPALGAIYALGYWRERDHPESARGVRAFYGLLAASMVLVLLARDGGLFLVAWEGMALSAFFLIGAEHEHAEVRRSAWIYLAATHVGTLCLFAMFALVRRATGTLAWDEAALAALSPAARDAVFVLALVGFGLKAGLAPLHVWLPPAHANAPSHVSAVLSGVMLKMGAYGVVRTLLLAGEPPEWWGAVLMSAGAASALFGMAFAVAQQDLKRLLAYSSIENVGIVFVGVGLAALGRSLDRAELVVLGLGGALLHTCNHAAFKPLLFFVAGSVLHGAGTRRLDRLGGLAQRMPRTAALAVIGCASASALPPLNGFASELLVYLGLVRVAMGSGEHAWTGPVCATVLALAGALALASYAKLVGVGLLGAPRSEEARRAHESPASMLAPILALALACAVLGAAPWILARAIDAVVRAFAPERAAPPLTELAPLGWVTIAAAALWVGGAVGFALLARAMKDTAVERPPTWDCGYARPAASMQYTGQSLSRGLADTFAWLVRPTRRETPVTGAFPRGASFGEDVHDSILDRVVLPATGASARLLRRLRVLQAGPTQAYVLYVLIAVLALSVVAYVA